MRKQLKLPKMLAINSSSKMKSVPNLHFSIYEELKKGESRVEEENKFQKN